ncbi:MAG: DUF2721 domain-containing protein [Acidobacteria bacterium]|nr:DUF2721 domain-containing protein [Acidobacteriota bacterium]
MQSASHSFSVLSAMITPAVLISACGTLIFSTSTRLARVVDRVRELSRVIEQFSRDENVDFPEERLIEVDRQIAIHARRGQLIQRPLTSFYVSLSLFVATTVAIGFVAVLNRATWAPNTLGIVGTVFLLAHFIHHIPNGHMKNRCRLLSYRLPNHHNLMTILHFLEGIPWKSSRQPILRLRHRRKSQSSLRRIQ